MGTDEAGGPRGSAELASTRRREAIDRRLFLTTAAGASLLPFPAALQRLAADPSGRAGLFDGLDASPLSPVAADYPLRPVRSAQVTITDEFWRPRMDANRAVSLPYCFDRFGDGGFSLSKLIEAAAYMIEERPDPELESYADGRIDRMLAELERSIEAPEQSVHVSGHVLEAATAYAAATGKSRLLDTVVRLADQMDSVYGPGKETYISGHQGLKIGLVALYRATGDERYWKLAKFFADERGRDDYERTGEYAIDRTYSQDHVPVVEQSEAVGHTVRATFLYIAMTDIAALSGDAAYIDAVHRIWEDQTHLKTYLTGGIGSTRFHEKYGEPHELPNLSAWNETCAAYGSAVWCHRLALLDRDARYVDVMERVLYNALLVGVSLRGDRFFYQNPLKSFGDYERFDWINVPCCPPNVIRMLASIGSYVYATDPSSGGLFVNLFANSDARIDIAGVPVRVRQETRYPWEGRVRILIDPERETTFPLHVRIPGWARGEVMPGELYRFADPDPELPTLRVGGSELPIESVPARPVGRGEEERGGSERAGEERGEASADGYALEGGYARLDRTWRPGDAVELDLPMPVRRVFAHESIEDDRGRVALQRGPLVYCAEWPDNGGRALNIVVPDDATFHSGFRPDLLDGIQVVLGDVEAIREDSRGEDAPTAPHQLTAIPYYAWANRGMGEMAVWMAREPAAAWLPPVLPAPVTAVRTSGGVEKGWTGYNDQNDDLAAIHDGREPINSADQSHRFFRMRPPVGERAWLEYEFEAPVRVSSSRVYFFDDKRFCNFPESWRVLWRDGGEWRPVAADGAFTVAEDEWSTIEFEPVVTRGMRLEVEPRTVRYEAGQIGPPAAMFIDEDIEWREFGIIEWQVG
ncbi:MAG: glycoside hydrolase family 127 protein [Gemmatimonadetes bacterium]|nr:glycoside hydrolase family 127 protein [Gemmatimonadota bacterium]MYD12638.1 glycoside hydrolase family 127 protein [Gemmatimonadota bacterium]MYI65387.1 glycoside hydrolase family 127 protein [Gemmatimonadota bacterium]